jgi:single-strand binding protein
MFNKIVLIGNLTRDIELRYASNGNAIGNTAIAVTRKFSVNGEKREETCFIDVTFFGKMAEVANQYLNKGSKLLVEGRLKFDQWTDNNGQNRSKHSVIVENMEMLGSPQNQQGQNGGGYQQQNYGQGGYAPQAGYTQQPQQQGYAQPAPQQRAPQQRAAAPAQQRQAAPQAGYAQPQQQGYAQPAQVQQQGAATPTPQQQQYAAPQAEAAYQHQYQEIPEIDVNEDMQGNEEIPF